MPARNDISTKPTPAREDRLVVASDLLSTGKSIRQVAAATGVSDRQARSDRQLIEARWQARQAEAVDLWKGRLIARYEKVYSEAMKAWELSLTPITKTQLRSTTRGEATTVTTTEGRGNSKMLEMALGALAGLANVLGLNDQQMTQLVVQRYISIAADDLGIDPLDFLTQIESIAGEAWSRAGLPASSNE